MHEGSIPADATLLKRGTDAPNDEDGRDLRLSAADRSATELYAAMIAPSGARPSVTKRQIAIRSLRAKATIAMRRNSTLKRANTVPDATNSFAPQFAHFGYRLATDKTAELRKKAPLTTD